MATSLTCEDYDKFKQAKELNECEDEAQNPYKSKYEARKLFLDVRNSVHNLREDNQDDTVLLAKEAAIEYILGVNFYNTEEVPDGEEKLKKVLETLTSRENIILKPHVISILIATYNQLCLLWSNRAEGLEKTFEHLVKAKELYLSFQNECDDAPWTVEEHFSNEPRTNVERKHAFESLHTYTLYYLAQVYKHLDKRDESAECCMQTLHRQLKFNEYKPVDWAINCASLSQYYVVRNKFKEAKHCLSCANYLLAEEKIKAEDNDIDRIEQAESDVARCWVKYFVNLLDESKEKLSDEYGELDINLQIQAVQNEQSGTGEDDDKSFERFGLEVTSIEESIPHNYAHNIKLARAIFLKGKQYAEDALKFFVMDGFVTDHVELIQDLSHLYQYMAFFEPSKEVQCKMHKRRIDLLSVVLKELNIQYYLAICRQLQYEIGKTYNEMFSLKLLLAEGSGNSPTTHMIKKMTTLCNSGIGYFRMFLNTHKLPDGNFPDRFEPEMERSTLLAHFYIGRLYSKKPAASVESNLQNKRLALENYKFITNYVDTHQEAEAAVKAEIGVCREMVDLLPRTLEQFDSL
uniref:KIF-binding protein n=1 Tax=Phallusia mammillata TaxID=59560 RepID=A0A6F9DF55_9ASCI|nr:KIF1-binding protein homolog [Phallusia mammillata]